MGLSIGSQPRIPFSSGLDADKPLNPQAGDIFYATDTAINYQYNGSSWVNSASNVAPIGSVIALLKTLTGTPSIPANWVECNGQTISDASSVYDGVVIPNLNGGNRFLRGSSTSGTTGGSETHTHSLPRDGWGNGAGGGAIGRICTDASGYGGAANNNTSGAASTLPSYYEVVWIIRIK
jgi:hypothetical protein